MSMAAPKCRPCRRLACHSCAWRRLTVNQIHFGICDKGLRAWNGDHLPMETIQDLLLLLLEVRITYKYSRISYQQEMILRDEDRLDFLPSSYLRITLHRVACEWSHRHSTLHWQSKLNFTCRCYLSSVGNVALYLDSSDRWPKNVTWRIRYLHLWPRFGFFSSFSPQC